MPVFAYKAYDADKRLTSGTVSADTAASGRQLLRKEGYQLVEFGAVPFKKKTALPILTARSRRQDQVSEFGRHLSLLLRSGTTLVDSLDVLIRQQCGRLGRVLQDVRDKVAAGSTLSDSLASHPAWFDNVFSSAVRVGEMSGQMDKALQELALYIREKQTIKARLFTALAYPMILTILGMGVVLFLMTFVIPQLMTVLEASGRQLPAATVFLKSLSDVLTTHWLAILLAGAVAVVGAAFFYQWRPGKLWCHQMQLKIPLLRPLLRKSLVAHFAQQMSLLLKNGVPFLEALRLVHGNTRHLVLAQELDSMATALQAGSDIAPTLRHSKVFPPLVIHMMDIGQQSGELTEMLSQLQEGYQTELRLAIGKFTSALEPILIVVLAVVIGFVVFATMMPILEATKAIQ